MNSLLSEKNPELHATMTQKNIEIESLGDALSLMEQKYADLELKYQIMDETVEESQKVTTNIKVDCGIILTPCRGIYVQLAPLV